MTAPRRYLHRSGRRILLLLLVLLVLGALAYLLWSPGMHIQDGRHDRRTSAIWLQHGWLADDFWFQANRRDKSLFRSDEKLQDLAALLASHGIKYVFPHACPCNPGGQIMPVDPAQTERLLDHFKDLTVIPWVGGAFKNHCFPESPQWRRTFIASIVDLLQQHPRLAGVHINIEPMPTGNPDFLTLLDELRAALPQGKILSIAAYPPPTRWHRFPAVHWDEPYFKQVARRVDQVVPMMYDTAIRLPKFYTHLMSSWTTEVLDWAAPTQVLLGVPAYDDPGADYHFPGVENLPNALSGIHDGLAAYNTLPENYAGVAIYSEWEMDPQEWTVFRKEFEKTP